MSRVYVPTTQRHHTTTKGIKATPMPGLCSYRASYVIPTEIATQKIPTGRLSRSPTDTKIHWAAALFLLANCQAAHNIMAGIKEDRKNAAYVTKTPH